MIFRPELAQAILDGRKTVTRRPVVWAGPHDTEPCRYKAGKTYAVQPGRGKPSIGRILIRSVVRSPMTDFTQEEAQLEGFEDIDAFVRTWLDIYGKGSWLDYMWRIEFELVAEAEVAA